MLQRSVLVETESRVTKNAKMKVFFLKKLISNLFFSLGGVVVVVVVTPVAVVVGVVGAAVVTN